ncbi:MAG TPA: HAD family phosphatase [Anaerolineaceae bacterium]|nr:HAD family phosphatase [Anaerolineaceae bacterium]HPN53251.1 HAD family phosphatase [Anaerolineaceae bacterium]
MEPFFALTSPYAVLWDLDGTLADTGEAHYQAWADTLAEEGQPFNRDLFRQTFGMNNTGVLTLLYGQTPPPEEVARISDRKERAFRVAIHGRVALHNGVHAWLEKLQQAGYRQAVASSAPAENIDVLVDELGIRPYFSELVSGGSLPGKPAPDVFLEAARRLNVAPKNCIVVEDAVPGVQAARSAGMKCIAITNTNSAENLAGADLITDDLTRLKLDDFTVN